MTFVRVNDKKMSSIQQPIPFQENNKPDSILMKFRFCYVPVCSGRKPLKRNGSVSLESTLDSDCKDMNIKSSHQTNEKNNSIPRCSGPARTELLLTLRSEK